MCLRACGGGWSTCSCASQLHTLARDPQATPLRLSTLGPGGRASWGPRISRISVAFTPPISRSKAHPRFLSYRKHGAELARSAKITMAAPQNPPFLGLVCFPPAENCSDRGAFCARRVEQQVVRAYPSSASGEHAMVCKCRAKFIKIWGFQNVALPAPHYTAYFFSNALPHPPWPPDPARKRSTAPDAPKFGPRPPRDPGRDQTATQRPPRRSGARPATPTANLHGWKR